MFLFSKILEIIDCNKKNVSHGRRPLPTPQETNMQKLLIRRYAPKGPPSCALHKLDSLEDSDTHNSHELRVCNWGKNMLNKQLYGKHQWANHNHSELWKGI